MKENLTTECILPHTEIYSEVIFSFLTIVIVLAGITFNSYVLHVIRIHTSLHTYANGFVVNICIADLLSVISLLGLTTSWLFRNRFLELIMERMLCSSNDVSIMMITAIGLDRYANLEYSLLYSSKMNGTNVRLIIVVCWIYSLLLSLLPFSWMSNFPVADCEHTSSSIRNKFILSISALYFPCLLITAWSYFKIYRIALCHSSSIAAMDRSVTFNYPTHRIQRSMKYVRTLLFVIIPLLIFSLPPRIYPLTSIYVEKIEHYLFILSSFICIANPLIYGYDRAEFRVARRRRPSPVNAERREEEIAMILSSIFPRDTNGSSGSISLQNPLRSENKEQVDNDTLSWRGFEKRKDTASKIEIKLSDEQGDMQLTIEDLERPGSKTSSIQLSVENFGSKKRRLTLSRKQNSRQDSTQINQSSMVENGNKNVSDEKIEVISLT